MATVVLSAAGAAIGGGIGGSVLGLSSAVIGQAVGASIGRALDQRLMGQGSETVETGRIDRFRLTGVEEGADVPRLFGRNRVAGQVIWSTNFRETTHVSGGKSGGKGQPPEPKIKEYRYSVSLAVALCQGEIAGIARVWADGVELAPKDLNMRVYPGSETQLPDPLMEAVEGAGAVPAYRGTAYVVFENLALGQFGNRVPQFNFEVLRPASAVAPEAASELAHGLKGVALMPGTGEYALASSTVKVSKAWREGWNNSRNAKSRTVNRNAPSGKTDLVTSLERLGSEMPGCDKASLIVSWFGDDLRVGECQLKPKVEFRSEDSKSMPWSVSGVSRAAAPTVARKDGAPVYGGTPTDQSVVEAIRHMHARGTAVMFYPFILMEQLAGNGLPDPWTGAEDQPELPWRGRITSSIAAGREGSPDGTAAAEAEVRAFFGAAERGDFRHNANTVDYTGPTEWSFRRFILHYAHLCAVAGGVETFCIGSEMRGLTWIRGEANRFVAVEELIRLAGDVRAILGSECKISYAADWSEYFGYQPQDGSGDRFFHLDPLWADDNIDFIGIDNYMPLSDWREGENHADAGWGSIYDLDYLKSNIEGGEGYDWYYHSQTAQDAQIRTPITDESFDEPWIWRYKDIRNWWTHFHHERVGGVRQEAATDWVPQSKPIWFTEFGCAAIDKGTNEPNKFLDPKSSESALPRASDGRRDETIQMQYYRAMLQYWGDESINPLSEIYGGPMIDMDNAFAWAWDARPYPEFPLYVDIWDDGANYYRGHWLNGRASSRSLASVVAEICRSADLEAFDVEKLYGAVRGYTVSGVGDARAALQPLMLAHGFEAVERDGGVTFLMRDGKAGLTLDPELLVEGDGDVPALELTRGSEVEVAGRVRVGFVEADGDFIAASEESVFPDNTTPAIAETELPLLMTRAEGRQATERWLAEARIAQQTARFTLPLSQYGIGAGDVVRIPTATGAESYRIDRVEETEVRSVEAVRVDPEAYVPSDITDSPGRFQRYIPPAPVFAQFLDLPLITGEELAYAPRIAVTADPWPGPLAVYSGEEDGDFELTTTRSLQAVIGVTETDLAAAPAGVWDDGPALRVSLLSGALSSVSEAQVLSGANYAAIGDGTADGWEIVQFAEAELVAENTYLLRRRLRGQAGTDALAPASWPAGSTFVLLDSAVDPIEFSAAMRGRARRYRIGPHSLPHDDDSYIEQSETVLGAGLRPLSPCHLVARRGAGGLTVSWIRRTRIEGDSWETPEVPVGEEREQYLIRLRKDGALVREELVGTPAWTYSAADQLADGIDGPVDISVAQVSAVYGGGLAASLTTTL
ncbi:baseplate multidomain protein megatron [Poseidonocella sedimentorum]|uniref:Putative phage tail protein n=1 Tax=Poseidonocella sedimentorum TaxID=871652 RepID=A0A1I6DGW8_9RHOB|nr:glycoside hydrolase/phage tail family protein [Poseidonocella sedimentorum]SFR04720.1 Putative phage tail protein [Poseidonocella sedimentorum]